MRKAVILLTVAALGLGGCAIGKGRGKALDEFAVARNAPLVIPPDYTLTPPVAGTVGLSATDAQSQAIDALFGGPAVRSATETSMLDSAGRDRAPVGARSTAGDPATRVVDKGAATPAIIAAPVGNGKDASVSPPQ
ncbi:DUF3035 domain-containing protein [Sphingomonas sp.]|uniref:DUF3035 domain-containing protein n=1 Tax=Sphingomonas sp. TaxID=28214 RepID=UPI00325FB3C3